MEIFASLKIFHLVFFLQKCDFLSLVDIFLEGLLYFRYNFCPNLIFFLQIIYAFFVFGIYNFLRCFDLGQSFTSFLFKAIYNFFICLFFQFIWFFNTFKILKNAFKIKSGWALKLFLGEKYPFNLIKLCFHQTSNFLLVFGI